MRATSPLMIAILGVWLGGAAGAQPLPTQEERQALAPTGKLRAALYFGGPTNVIKGPDYGRNDGGGIRDRKGIGPADGGTV